jgi:uncharacterized iron-regulated membrane protein
MRDALARVHRWFGLTAGIVAVYLALTGSWIVLRPVLDPVTYPHLLVTAPCTNPLPVDTLAAAARAYHPKGKITYVYLYGSPTSSTMVRFSDADQVYVDPCSAKVLGHQPRYGGLYGTVESLHKLRFMPAVTAMPIIGSVSLFLAVVLVGGGLFVWWPLRNGVWRPTLRFDRRLKGRGLALRLHTTVGVYASAIIFIVASTAVPLSLGWAKNALFAITHSVDMTEDAHRPSIATPAHNDATPSKAIPMQRALDETRHLVSGPFLWASIHYPAKGDPIEVGIVLKGATHADARNYVFVDSRSGAILEFRPWATLNAGSKLYYWALALHTGRVGGIAVQLLMLAAMIGVIAIGYTGVESFLRKKLRRQLSFLFER